MDSEDRDLIKKKAIQDLLCSVSRTGRFRKAFGNPTDCRVSRNPTATYYARYFTRATTDALIGKSHKQGQNYIVQSIRGADSSPSNRAFLTRQGRVNNLSNLITNLARSD
jgi:hypothetical protein